MYIAILIALIISVGGASVAAETAVPGDALYAVKTEFTEPVRGQLARSTEAQARWQAELADRRLAEARMLATRGTLNAASASGLSERFSASAAASLTLAGQLVSTDTEAATEITAEIDQTTRAYVSLLENRAIDIGVRTAPLPETAPMQMEASSGTEGTMDVDAAMEADASGTTVIDGSGIKADFILETDVNL